MASVPRGAATAAEQETSCGAAVSAAGADAGPVIVHLPDHAAEASRAEDRLAPCGRSDVGDREYTPPPVGMVKNFGQVGARRTAFSRPRDDRDWTAPRLQRVSGGSHESPARRHGMRQASWPSANARSHGAQAGSRAATPPSAARAPLTRPSTVLQSIADGRRRHRFGLSVPFINASNCRRSTGVILSTRRATESPMSAAARSLASSASCGCLAHA